MDSMRPTTNLKEYPKGYRVNKDGTVLYRVHVYIPQPIMLRVDQAARSRRVSRSGLIQQALEAFLS